MKILVTGSAGFIGFHLTQSLLLRGDTVVGIDNLNDYYDPALKKLRLSKLQELGKKNNFLFTQLDISNTKDIIHLFQDHAFDVVINLAAQAGVRYSIENPLAYINSNILGFQNVLHGCKENHVKHLIYASSSSVYGMNTKQPFSTQDNTDNPISIYAATKKANELMAHSYSHLFGLPTTGLRFFTVYGPYGRPDMAYFKFTKAILEGKRIDVYNDGNMKRDFTYIDDIVAGTIGVIDSKFKADSKNANKIPYRLYNIGNNDPIALNRFIRAIEAACEIKAKRNLLPMQPGDVLTTFADIDDLNRDTGFRPKVSIEDGMKLFVNWYKDYVA